MSEYAVHFLFKTDEEELLESIQRHLPATLSGSLDAEDYWVLSSNEGRENVYSAHIPFSGYTEAAEFCQELGHIYSQYNPAHPDSFLHVHRCYDEEKKSKEQNCRISIEYNL